MSIPDTPVGQIISSATSTVHTTEPSTDSNQLPSVTHKKTPHIKAEHETPAPTTTIPTTNVLKPNCITKPIVFPDLKVEPGRATHLVQPQRHGVELTVSS